MRRYDVFGAKLTRQDLARLRGSGLSAMTVFACRHKIPDWDGVALLRPRRSRSEVGKIGSLASALARDARATLRVEK